MIRAEFRRIYDDHPYEYKNSDWRDYFQSGITFKNRQEAVLSIEENLRKDIGPLCKDFYLDLSYEIGTKEEDLIFVLKDIKDSIKFNNWEFRFVRIEKEERKENPLWMVGLND